MRSIRLWRSENGRSAARFIPPSKRTVSPTLPATQLSRFTAAWSATDCSLCAAMPPATARLGRALANSRARAVTRAGSTPVWAATASGAYASTRSRASAWAPAPRFSPAITCTRASASASSPPGRTAIHSSALAPVSESRGSIATKRPACGRPRIFAKPRAWATGLPKVSRKSAPKDSTIWARSKSRVGISALPKLR